MILMNSSDIADIVRYFRKKSGLTQQKLAQAAGVGKTVVFDIEKGKLTIRVDTLLKILAVLNIQIHFQTPLPYDNEVNSK